MVPPINVWITASETAQRDEQVNDVERMLSKKVTVIVKFVPRISIHVQGQRLQERVDDWSKRGKLSLAELKVRKQ